MDEQAAAPELGRCGARFYALGVLARCGDTAIVRELVTCRRGHDHTAISCARHRYNELVNIGCADCLLQTGDDVPLRLVRELGPDE